MARVHIVQLLCPNRHCLLAGVYEEGRITFEQTKDSMEALFKKAFNPFCGICHSSDLHFEDGVTRFQSLAEAAPFLTERAAEQAAARAHFQKHQGGKN